MAKAFLCGHCGEVIVPIDIAADGGGGMSRAMYYRRHYQGRCVAHSAGGQGGVGALPPQLAAPTNPDGLQYQNQDGDRIINHIVSDEGEVDLSTETKGSDVDYDEPGNDDHHEYGDFADGDIDAFASVEQNGSSGGDMVPESPLRGVATYEGFKDNALGTNKEARKGSVAWFKNYINHPIHAHTTVTLRDWTARKVLYRITQNISRSAFNKDMKADREAMPKGNIVPPSWHIYAGIVGVESYHDYIRHICPCGGHIYAYIELIDYHNHHNDICPSCSAPRFTKGHHGHRSPAMWVFYLGVEHAIREYLFRNPRFVARRGEGRRYDDPSCFFGSSEARRMNEALQGRLFDPNNGAYVLFVDPYQPYDTKEHSTGAILLKSEEMGLEDNGKDEFAVPLMVIPGPSQPQSIKAHMTLIARDFEECMRRGICVRPTIRGTDGEISEGAPFVHHPVLVGLIADSPAAKAVLQSSKSCQAYMSCWYCKGSGDKVSLFRIMLRRNAREALILGFGHHVSSSAD